MHNPSIILVFVISAYVFMFNVRTCVMFPILRQARGKYLNTKMTKTIRYSVVICTHQGICLVSGIPSVLSVIVTGLKLSSLGEWENREGVRL